MWPTGEKLWSETIEIVVTLFYMNIHNSYYARITKTWIADSQHFFVAQNCEELLKSFRDTIWLSSKNTLLFKIRRTWLNNLACHAYLNLKLKIPLMSHQILKNCVFFKDKRNDITIVLWYFNPKVCEYRKNDFLL